MNATFRRLDPRQVRDLIATDPAPLVLDVRRGDAFRTLPDGITRAVSVVLDRQPIRLPDVDRNRPIIVYCL